MPTPVIMPKFEMAQETGTVSKWLKNEGDPVEKGEPILEIETDKINMEVEAPASGTLVAIQVGPGAVVPIGQPIAHILQPGEAPTTVEEKELKGTPSSYEFPQVLRSSLAYRSDIATPMIGSRTTPMAERIAEAHGLDLQSVPHQGERLTKADVETYLAGQQTQIQQTFEVSDKIRAVPAARRLAREMNIDLTLISGTGPDGRIQSEDVRQAIAEQAVAPSALPPAVDSSRPAIRRMIPLTGMRRTIAERLTASVREIPQFNVGVDVDMSRALAIVEDWRATSAASNGPRVTLTAFLVKACAWTLLRHPAINASFEQGNIIEWAEINIGVAVAVEEGLIVPIIRGANGLGLVEIAAQLADLSSRAREGQLRREDIQGGTFTISNLGMFGVDRFTAIINPPQAAILAVGRVAKQAVITADDRVEARPMASLTLTADHRLVDGVLAGRFLADLQEAIERPGVLL